MFEMDKMIYDADSLGESPSPFSSRIRVSSFSTAGSSGLVLRRYFAKNKDLVTCFSTLRFQALFLIFFFDFEVRFC